MLDPNSASDTAALTGRAVLLKESGIFSGTPPAATDRRSQPGGRAPGGPRWSTARPGGFALAHLQHQDLEHLPRVSQAARPGTTGTVAAAPLAGLPSLVTRSALWGPKWSLVVPTSTLRGGRASSPLCRHGLLAPSSGPPGPRPATHHWRRARSCNPDAAAGALGAPGPHTCRPTPAASSLEPSRNSRRANGMHNGRRPAHCAPSGGAGRGAAQGEALRRKSAEASGQASRGSRTLGVPGVRTSEGSGTSTCTVLPIPRAVVPG